LYTDHLTGPSELPGPGEAHRAANRRCYRKNPARPRRAQRRRPALPGTLVRVIAFTLVITKDDGTVRTEACRLITTLLDPAAFPAAGLAAAYARRWAAETAFAEIKTCLRGPGTVLRSGDPAGARQELWAFLVLYQAIRIVICAAAAGAGLDPGQVSFTTTMHAIRRHHAAAPAAALAAVEADILDPRHLIRHRPGRAWPRARRAAAPRASTPAAPLAHRQAITITITPPDQPPPHTHDQPQQPPQHPQASP
jgi:hypothetical protein